MPEDAQPMLLAVASTLDAPVPECVIKGNRTSQGECIYHVPDGRYYSGDILAPTGSETTR